jgi:Spy/CpxP family protein refolding chaperone
VRASKSSWSSSLARALLLAAPLLLALGGAAAAQPQAKPAKPAADRPMSPADRAAQRAARREARDKLRNEVMDQMRTMRMWKLTEELKLDQATAAKVFPVLAQYDEKGKAISKERWELARDVQDQVESGKPDEAKLRKLIDHLQANQARRNALDEERFKALRTALTPLQQAKLLLLLPRIEDDFRHRIREAIRAQKAQEQPPTQTDLHPPSKR